MNGTYDPVPAMRKNGGGECRGDHFQILTALENAFTLTADKSGLSISQSDYFQKRKTIESDRDVQDQEDGRNTNVTEEAGEEENIDKKIIIK